MTHGVGLQQLEPRSQLDDNKRHRHCHTAGNMPAAMDMESCGEQAANVSMLHFGEDIKKSYIEEFFTRSLGPSVQEDTGSHFMRRALIRAMTEARSAPVLVASTPARFGQSVWDAVGLASCRGLFYDEQAVELDTSFFLRTIRDLPLS